MQQKGRAEPARPYKAWPLKEVLPSRGLLRRGDQPFALSALAGQLAGATNGFGLLTGALLARLLIMHVPLHFAERAFALHLLLQRLEGLIDVVVANENLNQRSLSYYPFPLGQSWGQAAANGQKPFTRRL